MKRFPILAPLAAMALSLGSPIAHGAKFANQFVEFELPAQWQCVLESAEWVCQSTVEAKKKDAIIVLAAKLRGDQDGLEQYLAYLKTPKTYNSVQGKPVTSEPKYAKNVELNGQPWIDSLHQDSELPSFYTRYLATVKEDIGVLVTYSINKDKYQDYINDFEALTKTLKVFRKPGGLNVGAAGGNLFQQVTMPSNMSENTVFPGVPEAQERGQQSQGGGDLMMYLLLGAGVVGFIIWRKRKASGD